MKTILPALLLILSLLPPWAPAAPAAPAVFDFAALDAVVAAGMERHALPGAALAVVQGDEIAYLKGYGTAGGRAMTPRTQMYIGSQSKSFTALVVAQLAGEGLLDLNAPVQAYLPWFRVDDAQASSKITLDHLLHHTSGLSEAGYSVLLPADAAPEAAARSMAQARLTAPVGTKFQYFNTGYAVLACIIETVTGQSYAGAVKARVLEPLGMVRTTADPSQAVDLAQGYSRLFGFPMPIRQPVRRYEVSAGYIVSTAEDMAVFARAMMRGAGGLVAPEIARKIFTPGLGDYGMGWNITPDGGKIWHGGANEAFATEVNIYPKESVAFVLLVNEGHLLDHYISSEELARQIETLLMTGAAPAAPGGLSVRHIGWALGIFVLALAAFSARNLYQLKDWRERARKMTPLKKAFDVAISFLIPTVILVVVFTQMQAFFGYRFNLLTNLVMFRHVLPDIFILMLVSTIPDYTQGMLKLVWVLAGKTREVSQ